MILILLLATVILWLLYKKHVAAYKFWESRGVPSIPGHFPFGSTIDIALLRKYLGHRIDDYEGSYFGNYRFANRQGYQIPENKTAHPYTARRYVSITFWARITSMSLSSLTEVYKKGAPHPYIGVYSVRQPLLVLRDPEVIRLVMAKEFSHFRDRQGVEPPKNDPLSHHLFNLEGERWRALRVKLSPTFTSGKIKAMFPLFIKCAEGLDNLIFSKLDSSVDIKDVFGRFTTDIICSCAFGLEVNSIENSDCEFRKIGNNILKFSTATKIRLILMRIFPILLKIIPFSFSSGKMGKFMLKTIKDTVEHRENNNVRRNDFLDLLIELRNKGTLTNDKADEENTQPVEMTIEMMTAQCFVFLFAGFETSSSVQTFCLYELALHPEMQDRLRAEIDAALAKHGGVTYQAIQEMEYLDMVVSETMRKYPTLPVLTRRCTKDFVTPGGHTIDKGQRILIPVWSLHHDPDNFPNPDKFDPERFSPENKDSIKPFSYLPFGEGPRICIGMRFGLLQTKTGLITILRKYRVEPCEQTSIPLVYSSGSFLSATEGPTILKITKRCLS